MIIQSVITRPVYDEEAHKGNPFHRRTLGHLPTAHVAGVLGYFVGPFFEGGIVYWMPKFNFDDFLRYCGELHITGFFTVPPIYMAIAKHPAVKDQFRHMRVAASGAAPLTGELQKAATRRMKMSGGSSVTQTWGMSETTGAATLVRPGSTVQMGSLGNLLPNVRLRLVLLSVISLTELIRIRLVDDNDKDVKPGQPGEGLIKGPIVTQGYHNRPEANQSSFTSDGWLRTGDIFRIDGKELFVVDRKKASCYQCCTTVQTAD